MNKKTFSAAIIALSTLISVDLYYFCESQSFLSHLSASSSSNSSSSSSTSSSTSSTTSTSSNNDGGKDSTSYYLHHFSCSITIETEAAAKAFKAIKGEAQVGATLDLTKSTQYFNQIAEGGEGQCEKGEQVTCNDVTQPIFDKIMEEEKKKEEESSNNNG